MLKKIYETNKYVSENSRHVKINYDIVNRFADNFQEASFWLSTNPFDILDLKYKDIINFLLIFHTIGDYCFWGNPKWEIETEIGKLDGSFAIMYLILKRYKNNKNFDMTFEEFSNFLKGNIEIPLLQERFEQLKIMNDYLQGESFYNLIKEMKDDKTLFEYIISITLL